MKTHKLISAVLALGCALILSVSCGKNSDNAQESQPSAVLMSFISDYTEDMLDYCDIQVTFDNGNTAYQTIEVTKEILDEQLKLKCMLGSDTLPAILTISRNTDTSVPLKAPQTAPMMPVVGIFIFINYPFIQL